MSERIFLSLSKSYFQAAKNSFYYVSEVTFLLKPFALIIALFYSPFLVSIGLVFRLLVFLDWLGEIADRVRIYLLNTMQDHSDYIDDSFLSFLFRPIVIVLLCPLFLLSILIPKISNSVGEDIIRESFDTTGNGAFRKINKIVWQAAKNLFNYIQKTSLFAMPFVAIIAIAYSLILIAVGLAFILLIPIDWISALIEKIKVAIAAFSHNQKDSIRYNGGAFLFAPMILILLAPVFLAVILIPKFTSGVDTNL